MGRLVAVTGATGFVGPHLVAALARRGWKIRLLVRRWSPLPSLAGVEADLVLGDLSDEAALKRLVAGADTVIHAAGLIKARQPSGFHDGQSRRHGAALGACPRDDGRPAVVAGGARAASLALRREQARRRGSRSPVAPGPG